MKKKVIILSILIAIFFGLMIVPNSFSNSVPQEEKEDTYLYEGTDSIVTVKKGLARNIPETFGKYDRSIYPIPEVQDCSEDMFEAIKTENKEVMTDLESKIANGTLKKHIAADGQYYGKISDDVKAVEKIAYINTNTVGAHSLGVFIPAGEVATITIPDEYLSYFTEGDMFIRIGITETNAEDYAKGGKSRMPYLGYEFYANETEVKVGTPFGGMIYIQQSWNVPEGLEIPIKVTGAVDTPYYDLGRTTKEEWNIAKNAPGLYAELRTPYQRFMVPASIIREIDDPKDVLEYWNNVGATSTYAFSSQGRRMPTTMLFDTYVPAGAAVAFVGAWFCVHPTNWAIGALDYNTMMLSGNWGTMHEFNHHWQGTFDSTGQWGVGDVGEVTNNVMTIASYLLYTNIASSRSETNSIGGWEQSTDPYYNLKTTINDWKNNNNPITTAYMYASFMHEFGVELFLEVVKSNYVGGIYHGVELPAYKAGNDRYDDMALRMSIIFQKDLSMYMKEVLNWPISDEVVQKIKAYGYEEYIPVQNLYASGVKGIETGRSFFIPNDSYTFDFIKYMQTPGEVTKLEVGNPKYGMIRKNIDGTYTYTPNENNAKIDEFDLTVTVTMNGITNTRLLKVKIGIQYEMSKVETYAIEKSDLEEAITDSKTMDPFSITYYPIVNYTVKDGLNLSKATGYFIAPEDAEYEFQAYGDDQIKFILEVNDNSYTSSTVTYTSSANNAYQNTSSTHFTVSLKKGEAYFYILYCNNTGGAGGGSIAYRKVGEQDFVNLPNPVLKKEDIGKKTDKSFKPSEDSIYKRNLQVVKNKMKIYTNGAEVITYPMKQAGNENQPGNILDGNKNTFFHSAYTGYTITPFPHEYIIDYKSAETYNQIDIFTRNSNTNGTIGDYEIYISNDKKNWIKIAEDKERYGNSSKGITISVNLANKVSARYLKIVALNNKFANNFTIISEIELSNQAHSKKQIAQNSSMIKYLGNWTKKVDGVYVNGSTYSSNDGTIQYAFKGTSTMIYSTTDAKVQIKIDEQEWKYYHLIGSKYEPSCIIRDLEKGSHKIQVKIVEGELSLNLLATDGEFEIYQSESIPNLDPEPTILKGDVNLDKTITPTDLLLLKRHLIAVADQNWILRNNNFKAGDINEDKEITPTDLLLLKRIILG